MKDKPSKNRMGKEERGTGDGQNKGSDQRSTRRRESKRKRNEGKYKQHKE